MLWQRAGARAESALNFNQIDTLAFWQLVEFTLGHTESKFRWVMSFEGPGESQIDYHPCRYRQSKILFRGPARKVTQGHIAFLGGTETYGKYVPDPFPELVEERVNLPCINLGTVNAGIDAFLAETAVLELCEKADTVVIQTLGAHNMSNRFYSVHPRRNDRFLKASELLKSRYKNVDFTEYAFTRHMLTALRGTSPDRFEAVEKELKTAWVSRMDLLLSNIKARKILLHISTTTASMDEPRIFGPDPLFVDHDMVESLRPQVSEIVNVRVPDALARKTSGMNYPTFEEPAAMQIIGPEVHELIAEKLSAALKKKKPAS